MKSLAPLLLAAGLAYATLCAWLFLSQRSQIYFRTPETDYPAPSVRISSDGESIKVWQVERDGAAALVYFGGNAEDVAWNIPRFTAAFPDRSLYLVNYRGYGGSTGRPTEAGLFRDALAVFDHAQSRHERVAVMGRSLGSGVAMYVATRRDVERIVLVTPFDSLAKVGQEHFRFLPVSLLMLDRYDSASRVRDVSAPALLVVAGDDEIIPRSRSDALAAAFPPDQARVVVVAHMTHNSLDLSPDYLASVGEFLAAGR